MNERLFHAALVVPSIIFLHLQFPLFAHISPLFLSYLSAAIVSLFCMSRPFLVSLDIRHHHDDLFQRARGLCGAHFARRLAMSDRIEEILVHIAAPATAASDADYRSLARSYLEFEAGERRNVFTVRTQEPGPSSQNDRTVPPFPGTGLVINSPNLSFGSAFGNLTSPRPLNHGHENTQSSWVAPPSVIQDSLPENNVTFSQFCSPTRILEHYISGLESSQSNSSPSPKRKGVRPVEGAQVNQIASSQPVTGGGSVSCYDEIPEGDAAPSFSSVYIDAAIPTSSFPSLPLPEPGNGSVAEPVTGHQRATAQGTVIPLSPVIGNKRRLQTSDPQSAIEETRIASSYPSEAGDITLPSRAGSEPPAKKTRSSPPPSSGKPFTRSSSDIGPRQNTATRNLDHLDIMSPAPSVALRELQPADMITETLSNLADRVVLQERYRPRSQTRELRPFERGYWLLDCSSWGKALKDDAWEFLSDYLSQGYAGWGISCKRDQAFTWIRLYCWGCVVGHMYLVLWLASKRRAKHIGMSWVAGDGKPVIVTGARPSSR